MPLMLGLCRCALLSLFLASQAIAQASSTSIIPSAFSEVTTNCELNAAKLDSYVKYFKALGDTQGSVFIAIARRGDQERNRERLNVIRAALIEDYNLSEEEVVTAEGSPIKGFGRVEIYLAGGLVDTLLVHREKALCLDCCHPEGRKYLYPNHPKKKGE